MNRAALSPLLERDGYVLVPSLLDAPTCAGIAATIDSGGSGGHIQRRGEQAYAARDVFSGNSALLHLASDGDLLALARDLAGPHARPTKATFFDKRDGANWTLPLHQDLTITVRNCAEVPGYTHWSVKAGVPHVQPPVALLEQIVALRLHLDDCPVENGALEVVPGTHRRGRIAANELRAMHLEGRAVACPARAGDVLAMRPLLVHGSRKALVPGRRRVLHVEYCAVALDAPLEWPDWCA